MANQGSAAGLHMNEDILRCRSRVIRCLIYMLMKNRRESRDSSDSQVGNRSAIEEFILVTSIHDSLDN